MSKTAIEVITSVQRRRRQAAPHRRHGMVDQKISQHRVAEGSADERCHHRVSQGRAPLSQTESAKESGHYRSLQWSRAAATAVDRHTSVLAEHLSKIIDAN